MFFWRMFFLSDLKSLLILTVVLPLAACSGGDGGSASEVTVGESGSVALSWAAPTARADNTTPIYLYEIAGYNVYYRAATGSFGDVTPIYIDDSNNVANVRASISGIPVRSGTYFVVVTTVDTMGRESGFSSPEVEFVF